MRLGQVQLGSTLTLDFVVTNPNTGAAATADSVTVRVFEDANDTPILTPSATQRSGFTGDYRVQIACTTGNGFETLGKTYNVVVEVVFGGVTARAAIACFQCFMPIPEGAVVADGGNTSAVFMTDLAESTNDFWRDALLRFYTGTLAGQVKKITAYNGTTKVVTVAGGFTAAPSASDRFILINT